MPFEYGYIFMISLNRGLVANQSQIDAANQLLKAHLSSPVYKSQLDEMMLFFCCSGVKDFIYHYVFIRTLAPLDADCFIPCENFINELGSRYGIGVSRQYEITIDGIYDDYTSYRYNKYAKINTFFNVLGHDKVVFNL